MSRDYGQSVVKCEDVGSVTVESAAERIGVSSALLADLNEGHIDDAGNLVLDTAGQYRYRPVSFAEGGK